MRILLRLAALIAAVGIFDAAPSRALRELGSFEIPSVSDIEVVGERAYVLAGGFAGELRIYDLSDPTRPVEIASIPAVGIDLAISGGRAYVAGPGLVIVDVSNAEAPVVLGSLATAKSRCSRRRFRTSSGSGWRSKRPSSRSSNGSRTPRRWPPPTAKRRSRLPRQRKKPKPLW